MSTKTRNALIDVASACGLLVALGIVFGVANDTNSEQPSTESDSSPVVIVVDEGTVAPSSPKKELKLAVVTGEYDAIEKLLDQLGKGYRYDTYDPTVLERYDDIQEYDVIFLACGGDPDKWLGPTQAIGERNAVIKQFKPEYQALVTTNLKNFVAKGGILYASDWRLNLVSITFQDQINLDIYGAAGNKQQVLASVVNKGLREHIGDTIELNFDLPGWNLAAFQGKDVDVFLRAEVETSKGLLDSPLLTRINHGQGAVFATSFHNETQNSEKEIILLKYLVFASITEKENRRARNSLVEGGFSPQSSDIFSSTGNNSSNVMTYPNPEVADLKFVLGFENQGAELKMELFDPAGTLVKAKSGYETFEIEVPAAVNGDWKIEITAVKIPFDNFSYSLNIGSTAE